MIDDLAHRYADAIDAVIGAPVTLTHPPDTAAGPAVFIELADSLRFAGGLYLVGLTARGLAGDGAEPASRTAVLRWWADVLILAAQKVAVPDQITLRTGTLAVGDVRQPTIDVTATFAYPRCDLVVPIGSFPGSFPTHQPESA